MKKIIYFALLLSLIACSSDSDSSDSGGSSSGGSSSLRLTTQQFSATADGSGNVSFNVALPIAATAFQVTASSGSLASLRSSNLDFFSRADLLSSLQRSNTASLAYYANNLGLGADRQIRISFQSEPAAGVTLKVYSKVDPSLSSGVLRLNVILLGPVDNSEDVTDALDSALDSMRTIFSRAGINLDVQISSYAGPGIAPAPGDPLYQAIVSSQRPQAVNLILAADRKGNSSSAEEYGTIGANPFPADATAQSVIVLSIEDITGDGIFDDSEHNDEDRLLAEEMSRFTANALGLPNLLRFQGNRVTQSDNVPDSPGCTSIEACEEDSSSRTNVMFPEPLEISDEDREDRSVTTYYPRDQLTAMQKQILNNSVLVD